MGKSTTDKYSIPHDIIWQFDYEFNIQKLGDLYSKAKRDQWNTEVDINWDQNVDPSREIMNMGGMGDLRDSDFFGSLSNQPRLCTGSRVR